MKRSLLVFVIVLYGSWGCASAPVQTVYRFPIVPDSITDPMERTVYLVRHFWENSPAEAMAEQQAVETFFYALSKVPVEIRCEAVYSMLDVNTSNLDSFSLLGYYLDYFIGSPESIYWDDALYLASQRHIVNSPVPEEYKITSRWKIELLSKNPIGSYAPNVPLRDACGNITDLYSRSMPCLLVFANSECGQCKREQHLYAAEIEEAHRMGWDIVTIYTDGVIPPYSNVGTFADIDYNIIDNEIYVVRRLPSVYLIDENKKIVGRELKLQDVLHEIKRVEKNSPNRQLVLP